MNNAKLSQNMEISKTTGADVVNAEFTTKELNTLFQAGIIPDKTPPEQVRVFARVCAEKGLSPFSKQVYLTSYYTKEGPKYSIITGIDGFRSLAGRSGLYAGCEAPQYNRTAQGQWLTAADLLAKGQKQPVSCTITIYKIVGGHRVPFTAEVLFDEYASRHPKSGELMGKWATMPFNMLAKCAEAKAYKKAFPEQVGGMSIPEEAAAWEDTNTGMTITTEAVDIDKEETMDQVRSTLQGIRNLQDLKRYWDDNPMLVDDPEIQAIFTERKKQIKNG